MIALRFLFLGCSADLVVHCAIDGLKGDLLSILANVLFLELFLVLWLIECGRNAVHFEDNEPRAEL